MADRSWKAFERRVAAWFPNSRRRGADTRSARAGKSDVVADGWAPEVKLLGRPSFSDLLEAAYQSERNARDGEIPVAVVKRKRDEDRHALVVMRLEVFGAWFLPSSAGAADSPAPACAELREHASAPGVCTPEAPHA